MKPLAVRVIPILWLTGIAGTLAISATHSFLGGEDPTAAPRRAVTGQPSSLAARSVGGLPSNSPHRRVVARMCRG